MSKTRWNLLNSNKLSSGDKAILSKLARSSVDGLISGKSASDTLNIPSRVTAILLSRLGKKGWLRRVKRAMYFVLPLEATEKEGGIAADPWVVASVLFAPCYIGGWSAAEYWELTEQLFRSTFVVSAANIRSKEQQVLGNEFHIVRVAESRLKNMKTLWRGRYRVYVSDKEQTLIDGMLNPDWVGGFRHLADMLVTYLENPDRNLDRLIETAKTINKGVVFKRLGYILEHINPRNQKLLSIIWENISSGVIKLDPAVKTKGKLNSKWGLWENVSI
jgi:predicted transcriptional regulator of viral defense system